MNTSKLLLSDRNTYPSVTIVTKLDEYEWVSGKAISRDTPRLAFTVEGGEDFSWPDYIVPNCSIPLFSEKMYNTLLGAGVTTMQSFLATVLDTITGISREYYAINITTTCLAMDLERSDYVPGINNSKLVRSINKLHLDESRCNELLFRLTEYDLLIIIKGSAEEALLKAELNAVILIEPENWNGF
jgi:hypothetical protein